MAQTPWDSAWTLDYYAVGIPLYTKNILLFYGLDLTRGPKCHVEKCLSASTYPGGLQDLWQADPHIATGFRVWGLEYGVQGLV